MQIEKYIDHTLLKPVATSDAIKQLCAEALEYNFYAVCVNSCYVALAREELKDSEVKIAAVVGFPLGAMSTKVKVFEAQYCTEKGANEIDMVMNLGWLKSGEFSLVKEEIALIKQAIGSRKLKVIIETCYLTAEERKIASMLVVEGNADFVKTSTGFGSGGATFEDIKLISNVIQNKIKIKASGGIKDKKTALRYLDMGVSRLGTSSGIAIVNETNP